jgi:hypothetical protein
VPTRGRDWDVKKRLRQSQREQQKQNRATAISRIRNICPSGRFKLGAPL